jgi:hypothetical protein
MSRVLAAALAVAAASAAGTAGAAPKSRISCGEPTPLHGRYSPRVGPLVFGFYNYPSNTSGRAQSVFDPGYPTKVVLSLQPRRRLRFVLKLRGWSCRNGTPLRFWYAPNEFPREGLPLTADRLRRIGALEQVLPATKRVLFGGYMLFTEAGRWKVSVYRKDRKLGSVVVQVVGH